MSNLRSVKGLGPFIFQEEHNCDLKFYLDMLQYFAD